MNVEKLINDRLPMQVVNPLTVYSPMDMINIFNKIENRLDNLLSVYNPVYKSIEMINTINYLFSTAFYYLNKMLNSNKFNKNEMLHKISFLKNKYNKYKQNI